MDLRIKDQDFQFRQTEDLKLEIEALELPISEHIEATPPTTPNTPPQNCAIKRTASPFPFKRPSNTRAASKPEV